MRGKQGTIGREGIVDLPTIELRVNSKPMRFSFDYGGCLNPDCSHKGPWVKLIDDERVVGFSLDLDSGAHLEMDYSSEEREIIDAFIAFLKSPENKGYNLEYFRRFYQGVQKTIGMRQHAIALYKPGLHMPYREIFGPGSEIEINIGGKDHYIIDTYCVTPGCRCTDVMLYFFEPVHTIEVREPDFSFLYDYSSRQYKELTNITRSAAATIGNAFPEELVKTFRMRHKELKKDVGPHIARKVAGAGIRKPDKQKRKVGRNEPCPCGSGKKYKKCCLLRGRG